MFEIDTDDSTMKIRGCCQVCLYDWCSLIVDDRSVSDAFIRLSELQFIVA